MNSYMLLRGSVPNGSAVSWLAPLDMLKFVAARDLDTTLIVEDDVDRDVANGNKCL
jgi:hypothetical protein